MAKAFKGIKAAVGILIARAALNLWKKTKKDWQSRVLMLLAFTAMMCGTVFAVNVSTIVLIMASGIVGILSYKIKRSFYKGDAVS